MFKNSNKFFIFILMLSIITSMLTQPLFADSINESDQSIQLNIQPRWTIVSSGDAQIWFENSKLVAVASVAGDYGATYKNGTVTLTKLTGTDAGWTKKWTNLSSEEDDFYFSDNSVTPTRGQYQLDFTITAVLNGVEEVFSASAQKSY